MDKLETIPENFYIVGLDNEKKYGVKKQVHNTGFNNLNIELIQYHKELDKKKQQYYNKWLDHCLDQFSPHKNCEIIVPEYGPNYDFYESEYECKIKAVNDFLYTLGQKGYLYKIAEKKRQVICFLKGKYIECDNVLYVSKF